jgi:pimeloyl-ACP methyl ester carboxylesterase
MEPRTRALAGLAAFALVGVACLGGIPSCRTAAPAAPASAGGPAAAEDETKARSDRLHLVTRDDPRLGRISRGTYTVFENRAAASGRTLELDVVVLHARAASPAPDALFLLAGGPGQDATMLVEPWIDAPIRVERDVVLVSQRGTGGSMRLACAFGSDDDLQTYLGPIFQPDVFRACLAELSARADLTQYSTASAMDDLDEVRAALGYAKIDLYGGSYGTRAALVYMRQHPETVRCAILEGVAPLAFTNPLYHAREAQAALERIFAECDGTPECHAAFPELRAEFEAVLARLAAEPVTVAVAHPETGERVDVRLSRTDFAEALRVLLYSLPTSRQVPMLVDRAAQGDFEPFASAAIDSNRALRRSLAFGMLLCVTCSEDVARIDPSSIARETDGTFLGGDRVRQQQAVCAFWPRSTLPDGFAEPVRVDVPTLVLSGTIDPVTSPRWGEEAARHLSHALHLVVPGAHGIDDPCVDSIRAAFLDDPDIAALDTSCVTAMRLPPFELGG